MPTFDPFFLALAALAVDSLTGDPGALYRWLPHPVAALGSAIDRLDRRFNVDGASDAQRLTRGGAVAIGVTLAAAAAGALLHALAMRVPAGGLVEAIVASTLIAFRGLYDHVHAVARAMRAGIAEARAAVSHVVGRNPEHLDGPGVARAAIESVAENFADAVVAPILLVRAARSARSLRLQGDQHPRQHDRKPRPAPSVCSAGSRRGWTTP